VADLPVGNRYVCAGNASLAGVLVNAFRLTVGYCLGLTTTLGIYTQLLTVTEVGPAMLV
jgi:hypothetical protein